MKNTALRPDELSGFCTEIALMLGSGMNLFDGMETLAESYKGTALEELYQKLYQNVLETGSLAEALKADDRWPSYLREMAGVGERTGRLEDTMNSLSVYYEREGRIRAAIVSAITYPVILGVMMLLIVLLLILQVLPVFRRVLNSMGVAMTASGTAMMNIGTTVGWVVLVLVALVVLTVVACVLLSGTGHRDAVMAFVRKIFPPIGKVEKRLAASRVASVLSMMLNGGFPLQEALEVVPAVLEDANAAEKVAAISTKMAEGVAFEDCIADSGLFDEMHSRMIRMGMNAGRGDQVMEKIATLYEDQVEEGISGLVSIIEPSLVALLSVVIGAILMAVMLPMAGMISSLV